MRTLTQAQIHNQLNRVIAEVDLVSVRAPLAIELLKDGDPRFDKVLTKSDFARLAQVGDVVLAAHEASGTLIVHQIEQTDRIPVWIAMNMDVDAPQSAISELRAAQAAAYDARRKRWENQFWQELPDTLRKKREQAREILDKFTTKLGNDPIYALRWANGAFDAAGELKVCNELLAALENDDKSLPDIEDWVTRRAIKSARRMSRSSSNCGDLLARCEIEAWAELAEQITDRYVY